ncbi:MAG: nitrite reductase [Thermoplasmata archaeon]
MDDDLNKYINTVMKTMPSEDLYFEAVRDIMKDLIKEYIKKKINSDENLKKELAKVIEDFMEARLKQYDAMANMAKVLAKIGFISAPNEVKNEVYSDFVEVFQKEIEDIMKKIL